MRKVQGILAIAGLVGLVACNTAGRNIPNWQQAQRQIEWHYENNAWERGASCIPPRLLGITETGIVSDTPEHLTLDVRYMWDVEGQGDDEMIGVPCFGQGQRVFVLDKQGGGYTVASMTGPQRE
jgi:hypothetical protein